MSDIVKFDPAPNLTDLERVVIDARSQPMIMHCSEMDIEATVIAATGSIIAIKGLKDVPEEDYDFIISFVSKSLRQSFTTYRLPEFLHACELWASGQLFNEKDLNVLSAENMLKILPRYTERIRKEALAKQHKFEKAEMDKLAKERENEKRQLFDNSIYAKYASFNGEPVDLNEAIPLAAMYRRLIAILGKEQLTTKERQQIYDDCCKQIETEYLEQQAKKPSAQIRREFIQDMPIDQWGPSVAKTRAQATALFEVFKKWNNEGLTLMEDFTLQEGRPESAQRPPKA